MSVKKKVSILVEKFIDKGSAVKEGSEKKFKKVLIGIPSAMVLEIDFLVEEKGWGSRTSWIIEAIQEKLIKDM